MTPKVWCKGSVVNGRKGFVDPTPKDWDKGFTGIVVSPLVCVHVG